MAAHFGILLERSVISSAVDSLAIPRECTLFDNLEITHIPRAHWWRGVIRRYVGEPQGLSLRFTAPRRFAMRGDKPRGSLIAES